MIPQKPHEEARCLQWLLRTPPEDGTEDRKDDPEVPRLAYLEYTAWDKREPTATGWKKRNNCLKLSSDVHVCAMTPILTHMHPPTYTTDYH